jgi:hypothetical protein
MRVLPPLLIVIKYLQAFRDRNLEVFDSTGST